jgi:tRNA-dihydrouridine synthase A
MTATDAWIKPQLSGRTLSVAPMMDWTDRHCRYFHRLLSSHALLYTEMVTTGALVHGDQARHLDFSSQEHPVAMTRSTSTVVALLTGCKEAPLAPV